MKRLLTAACLSAVMVVVTGCQNETDKPATGTTGSSSANTVANSNADLTANDATPAQVKVTLSVPAMT